MADILTPLAIGGSALLGGISSLFTGSSNRKIAREQNDLQIRLANQKYAKDLEQWHRENEYNSPLAQKQRLLAAGLNPALNNVSAGTASSSVSAALPSLSPLPVQEAPFQNLPSDVASIISTTNQNRLIKEQERGLSIDNYYKGANYVAELKAKGLDNEAKELQNKLLGFEVSKQAERYNLETQERQTALDLQKAQLTKQNLENSKFSLELSYLPEQLRLTVAQMAADYQIKLNQGEITRHQIVKEILGNKYLQVQIAQANLDLDTAQKIQHTVISMAVDEAGIKHNQRVRSYWEKFPTDEQYWQSQRYYVYDKWSKTKDPIMQKAFRFYRGFNTAAHLGHGLSPFAKDAFKLMF